MKMTVVTSADKNFASHAGVMITSLYENNKGLDLAVYLIYENFREEDIFKLHEMAKAYGRSINLVKIDSNEFSSFPTRVHASLANYYRLFIVNLLPPTIDKVLYLDADLLVLKSLGPLFQIAMENYGIAAVSAHNAERTKVLAISEQPGYFNSGVMLINLAKWRSQNILNKLLNYIEENPHKLKFWDQDALNAVLTQDRLPVNPRWNVTNVEEDTKLEDVSILHYVGPYKPWNIRCTHKFKYLYHEYRLLTNWPPIKFKEYSRWHHIKQSIKSFLNKTFGLNFKIFYYDNFS